MVTFLIFFLGHSFFKRLITPSYCLWLAGDKCGCLWTSNQSDKYSTTNGLSLSPHLGRFFLPFWPLLTELLSLSENRSWILLFFSLRLYKKLYTANFRLAVYQRMPLQNHYSPNFYIATRMEIDILITAVQADQAIFC